MKNRVSNFIVGAFLILASLSLVPEPAQADNANSSARSAKVTQLVGVGANTAASVYYYGKCSSCSGTCTYYCVMGAVHAAQAASMLGTAQGAGKTEGLTDYSYSGDGGGFDFDSNGDGIPDSYGSGGGSASPGSTTGTNGNQGSVAEYNAQQKKIDSLLAGYNAAGYKLSADGSSVTTPDGKTVSAAGLNSAAAMTAMGLNAEQIDDVQNMQRKVANDAKKKLAALQLDMGSTGGEGGGAGGASRRVANDGSGGFDMSGLFADKKPKAPQVSGLSKNFGDSRIGVPQDNIFDMVSRQYNKQADAQKFLSAPAAPAQRANQMPRPAAN